VKRLLLISGIAAALLVPAQSVGAGDTSAMSSPAAKRGGFDISFTTVSRNGRVKRVKDFQFAGVGMTCETGGPFTTGTGNDPGDGFGPMKVENKEFGKKFPTVTGGGGSGTVKIAGEFRQHFNKAVGTLRVKGDYPSVPAENCDSSKLDWVAE
jgi:hypothetical protein